MNPSTRPPILIASTRPQTGQTLLALMLADWLGGRDPMPCALGDADPARGTLARLTSQTSVTVNGEQDLPAGAIVDNAELLGVAAVGDTGPLPRLRAWLKERARAQPKAAKPLLLVPMQDHRHSDCVSLGTLRSLLDPAWHSGVVAVRNAGAPSAAFQSTLEDQAHVSRGGWGNSAERRSWLIAGGSDLVFSRPSPMLLRQLRMLGQELIPSLLPESSALWLLSRQQLIAWRRDFAERAERTLQPLLPNLPAIRS